MDCNYESESFVRKFYSDGKSLYAKFCIYSKNECDLFSIQVFSDNRSWSGRFSYKEAETFGDYLQEDIEEYSRNVKEALKRDNNVYKLEFTVNEDGCTSKFTWKRTFTDSSATMAHGFVALVRDDPAETKDNIIDFLLDSNKSLQNKIKDLEHNSELLSSKLDKCTSDLEKFVNIKESLESTLYGKFVQILNAKKRRISLLKDHIANIESADS